MNTVTTTLWLWMVFISCPNQQSVQREGALSIECSTNEGYLAAISEKYLDDVIRYSIDKDYVALQKLMDAGVAIVRKPGLKVYIVETHIYAGKVEFRIPGYTEVLWTVTEGLKCS